MKAPSFNQVRISRKALCHNYRLLQKKAGQQRLLAMVKADAYGHGMCEAAAILATAGCTDFGVAELCEGVVLRESGIQGKIFIFLGFEPSQASLLFEFDLTPVLYDEESGRALSREAVRRQSEIAVHLKVDCGMTRLGVFPDQFEAFMASLEALPGVRVEGVASHFPRADEQDSDHTRQQLLRFQDLAIDGAQSHKDITWHTANSGGILYFPECHCDMVRAGIALYGYYPDGISGIRSEESHGLENVMSFVTRVLQVKTVPADVGVSYGHSYVTSCATRLAVLPVGYEDGLSRSLSNVGEVLIGGRRAKIRGRICMNLCMVDVTHIEGVCPGDEVVILGEQGIESIRGDDIAQWMGSISYEVLCLFGNNNERKYIE
jgi:alanine racemase